MNTDILWPVAIVKVKEGEFRMYCDYSPCQPDEVEQYFEHCEKFGTVIIKGVKDDDNNIVSLSTSFDYEDSDLDEGIYCIRTVIKNDDNSIFSYATHIKHSNLDDAIAEIDQIRDQYPTIFAYIETKENGKNKIVFYEGYLNFIGEIIKPGRSITN